MSKNSETLVDQLSIALFFIGISAIAIPNLLTPDSVQIPIAVRLFAFVVVLLSALAQIGLLIRQRKALDRSQYLGRMMKVVFFTAYTFGTLAYLLPVRGCFKGQSRV